MEQWWHGNLQQNVRALMILLHVGCVELDTQDVTFGRFLEGLNDDHYSYCLRPIKGNYSHQRWLKGPVIPLTKADRVDYVALILQRIFKFLQLE